MPSRSGAAEVIVTPPSWITMLGPAAGADAAGALEVPPSASLGGRTATMLSTAFWASGLPRSTPWATPWGSVWPSFANSLLGLAMPRDALKDFMACAPRSRMAFTTQDVFQEIGRAHV